MDYDDLGAALRYYSARGYRAGNDGVVSLPTASGLMVLDTEGTLSYWHGPVSADPVLAAALGGHWCRQVRDWRDGVGVPGSPLSWQDGRGPRGATQSA